MSKAKDLEKVYFLVTTTFVERGSPLEYVHDSVNALSNVVNYDVVSLVLGRDVLLSLAVINKLARQEPHPSTSNLPRISFLYPLFSNNAQFCTTCILI